MTAVCKHSAITGHCVSLISAGNGALFNEGQMIRSITGAGVVVFILMFDAFSASGALVFNITNQGAASAQMMTGMAQAAALWSAQLSDPITINVRINAVALPAGQLGGTGAFFDSFSYDSVR